MRTCIVILCLCFSSQASSTCESTHIRYTAIGAAVSIFSVIGFGLGIAGAWVAKDMKIDCSDRDEADSCKSENWKHVLMTSSMASLYVFLTTGLIGAIIFLQGRMLNEG